MNTISKLSCLSIISLLPFKAVLAEPYAGVGLGYGTATIEKKVNYNDSSIDITDKYNGYKAHLLVGYNFREFRPDVFMSEDSSSSDLFFSVEGQFTYSDNEATARAKAWFLNVDAAVEEKLKYNADLFVLAKYAIQPNTILFAGPGLSVAELEIKTRGQTAGNLGVTGSERSTVSGWAVKGGVDVAISDNMSVFAFYQYADYETTSFSGIEPLTGQQVTAKYNPTISSVMVGVEYH